MTLVYKGLRKTGQGRRRKEAKTWFKKSLLNLIPWGAQEHKLHHRGQKARL